MLKAATTKLKKKKDNLSREQPDKPTAPLCLSQKTHKLGRRGKDPVMQQGNTCHVHNA